MENRKVMKYISVVLMFIIVQIVWIASAFAITWGYPDSENEYPYIGAMVVFIDQDHVGLMCSGSLIHPQVFLTAGHCTYSSFSWGLTADNLRVSFDNQNVLNPSSWLEVKSVYWHPSYDPRIHPAESQDVGVLILKEPVTTIIPLLLPSERYLDELKKDGSLLKAYFIRAGYGTRLEWPPPQIIPPDGQRWVADNNKYKGLTKRFIMTSQNNAAGNNGTGYGDSGSPVLWTKTDREMVAVGVTSIGDPKLVSNDVPFRIDTPEALDFILDKIREIDPDWGNLAPPAKTSREVTATWGRVKSSF